MPRIRALLGTIARAAVVAAIAVLTWRWAVGVVTPAPPGASPVEALWGAAPVLAGPAAVMVGVVLADRWVPAWMSTAAALVALGAVYGVVAVVSAHLVVALAVAPAALVAGTAAVELVRGRPTPEPIT